MPLKFEKPGLAFQYPDNWMLDEDEVSGDKAVTVYTPGGGFWSVSVHHGPADPVDLADSALKAMKEEYKDLEIEEINETIVGRKIIGYDLNFFLLDFTNTAQIRTLRCNKSTYTILCQAEDHEFEQIQRVFQAMTVSLLNELKDLSYWD